MVPFEQDSIAKLASAKSNHPWLESIVITAVFFIAGVANRPDDPLMAGQAFPWSLFAIILIGMRYGAAEAFASAVGLHMATGLYGLATGLPVFPLPLAFSLGLFTCALVVGEFRDIWEQGSEKLERSNEYRQARLEEFTRSYHVLKISHDALEQEHAGRRNSLRSAMLSARSSLNDARPDDIGDTLLELMATYIAARTAGFYPLRGTSLDTSPAASIGDPGELKPDDPMLMKALQTRVTVSVRPEDTASLASRDVGDSIVFIPVVDAYQQLHGVISITQIPFFSLTERNLQLGSIIASRFADCLRAAERLQELEKAKTDEAADPATLTRKEELYWFCYQTLRCLDQANAWNLESHLLVHRFANPEDAHFYVNTVQSQTRGLDVLLDWEQPDGQKYLLMLLPLTTKEGVELFMRRFGNYIKEAHSLELMEAGIDTHRLHVQQDSTKSGLISFVNRFLDDPNEISSLLGAPTEDDNDVRLRA